MSRGYDPTYAGFENTQNRYQNQYIFRYHARYIKNPKNILDSHKKYEKSIPPNNLLHFDVKNSIVKKV